MAQRASEIRAAAAAAAAAGGSAAPSSASTASALRAPYAGGGGGGGYQRHAAPPPPDAPLPDHVFFGGVSALAEPLDRTMLLVLRDGRLLFGALSSYDQYGSVVLENAKERLTAQGKYADIDMGMYMIRGENIMLIGELVRGRRTRARAPFGVRPAASRICPTPPTTPCARARAGRGAGRCQPPPHTSRQGGGGGPHSSRLEAGRRQGRRRGPHVRGPVERAAPPQRAPSVLLTPLASRRPHFTLLLLLAGGPLTRVFARALVC